MKTKRLLALLVLALVVATCLCIVGCGECKHQGGTATCIRQAVCEKCNQPYGQYDDNNHQSWTTTVVSQLTCTTDGVTEYSCTCGYKETKTTPKLSQTGHNYVDGICTTCNLPAPSTSGLEFTLNGDGNSYTCTGIGSCTSTQILIASYNNKPVTAIGYEAFKNCSNLTSVTIGNSVTTIRYGALFGCSSLTSIKVATDNPNYCSQDSNLYNKDKTTLIQYACGKTATTFTIPDSVTHIGVSAFYSCSNLTSIVIPNSVTTIGEWAFANCSNLTSIVIPDGVTSIGYHVFYDCDNLTSIVIPDSVTNIGYWAFYRCSNLTIYCQVSNLPYGWNVSWNVSKCPVYWAGQWHYDDNGNPTPNN